MRLFGTLPGGAPVHAIPLAVGPLRVEILTYGAILRDVRLAPLPYSLTIGADDLADYREAIVYHGAIVGPLANRISGARVTIDGMTYELERNEAGRTHLHSGNAGVHRRIWQIEEATETSATLRCDLRDGDCGLPGNRIIRATYTVTDPACLTLTLRGETDALTLMNFANHSFWNLDGSDDWRGHALCVSADRITVVDEQMLPTGKTLDVAGSPYDLRSGPRITPGDPPLDTNFCLSDADAPIRKVAELTGASGFAMSLETTASGLQVFDNAVGYRPGKAPYEGIALEAQSWPDAPAHANFPSIRVTPDQPFTQTTRWKFHG